MLNENKDLTWDEWFTEEEQEKPSDDFLETPDEDVSNLRVETEETDNSEEEVEVEEESETERKVGEEVEEESEESEEEVEETQEEEEEEEVEVSNEFIEGLKAQGLLTTESDDIEEILENVEETVLQTIEKEVEGVFEQFSSDLGAEGKQFLQFVKAGGKPNDYFKTYTENNIDLFDMNTESGQENFLRWYYTKVEQSDSEEVSDKLEYLQSSDKVEKTATRLFEKVNQKRKEQRQQVVKTQQEKQLAAKKTEQERKSKLRKSLLEVKEVAGFKISPSERRAIYTDLVEPTEKVGQRYVPKFVAEITRLQKEDPAKLALLAKLIRTDFDFTPLLTKAKTKVSKKVKRVIQAETKPTLKKPKQTSTNKEPVWRNF